MLTSLRLRDVGPAPKFEIELSDRLNLFTGDNGLGKSFILDIAWWALAGDWAGPPAWPRRDEAAHPLIEFCLYGKSGPAKRPTKSGFSFDRQEWTRKPDLTAVPRLAIYARIDGGFSIYDPARRYIIHRIISPHRPIEMVLQSGSFHFTHEEVWRGKDEGGHTICNGLIRDLVSWQTQPKMTPFAAFCSVIGSLASSPEEPIGIGSPIRISPLNVQDVPTLTMPYGEVPLVHASAAMKRVANFAYLLTWAWDEHKRASEMLRHEPANYITLLVDEVELHLHPRWQRTLLPSLMDVGNALKAEVELQVLATTHAPLVLASIESRFDEERDSLFLFELEEGGTNVSLQKLPWAKHGDAVAWLTSPVFGLEQARSREAESAIEAAEAFMRGDVKKLPAGLKTKAGIQKALEKSLAGMDPFWPRWIVETKR
jgi:AAA domain, putative AbiEii toxin, Type IV TA system/AAA domain